MVSNVGDVRLLSVVCYSKPCEMVRIGSDVSV